MREGASRAATGAGCVCPPAAGTATEAPAAGTALRLRLRLQALSQSSNSDVEYKELGTSGISVRLEGLPAAALTAATAAAIAG